MLEMQCWKCNARNAMLEMQCWKRNAGNAMQEMQCFKCALVCSENVIFAHYLQMFTGPQRKHDFWSPRNRGTKCALVCNENVIFL